MGTVRPFFCCLVMFALAMTIHRTPATAEEPSATPSAAAPAFDLLFMSDRGGSSQLHYLDLTTGEATAWTADATNVYGPRWRATPGEVVYASNSTSPATLMSRGLSTHRLFSIEQHLLPSKGRISDKHWVIDRAKMVAIRATIRPITVELPIRGKPGLIAR